MANGINVDPSRLQEGVDKLKQLQTQLSDVKGISEPTQVGGGNTVQKIIEITQLYSEIGNALDELLANSVDYFTKVKESTVQVNKDTSAAILGGEADSTSPSNKGNESGGMRQNLNIGSDVTRSYNFGAAEIWQVNAYPKGSTFQKDIWPKEYHGTSGCAVSSLAMALSTVGVKADPKDIMAHNSSDNPEYMLTNTWKGTNYRDDLTDVGGGYKQNGQFTSDSLDNALQNYKMYPGQYSAPVIDFSYPGKKPNGALHYVVVVGKNEDGSYIIVDGSGNDMKKYTMKSQNEGFYRDKTTNSCAGELQAIHQYRVG